MGYRLGARTWRGRLFDALWAFLMSVNGRAKAVHYWIGTDVLNVLVDHRSGRLLPRPMARAKQDLHWADAPWLVDELAEVGLHAHYVALPVPLGGIQPPDQLPLPFTVLTYIPDGRSDFYDGPAIHQVAQQLPDVQFEVIGGKGTWTSKPLHNLTFLGWQEDVRPFLSRASVLVRLVRHDGMGGTVREALEAGLHVIYSQTMPCVTVVPYHAPDRLAEALTTLYASSLAGNLRPNLAGRRYVQEAFNLEVCLDTYLTDLCQYLEDRKR